MQPLFTQKNVSKKLSKKLLIAGILMIIVGIFGVVNMAIFGVETWYQFILAVLYASGIIFGFRLTKGEGWAINLALVIIYFVHFFGIVIENGIEPPAPTLYLILSFVALILLVMSKNEFDERYKTRKETS